MSRIYFFRHQDLVSRLRYQMGFSFYHLMVGKARNSTEEEPFSLLVYTMSCDLLSWLHNWQSFLVALSLWPHFGIPVEYPLVKYLITFFLRLEMMITFVLRLILLRKLVLFSFHMLRSWTSNKKHESNNNKKGKKTLVILFALVSLHNESIGTCNKTRENTLVQYDLISILFPMLMQHRLSLGPVFCSIEMWDYPGWEEPLWNEKFP